MSRWGAEAGGSRGVRCWGRGCPLHQPGLSVSSAGSCIQRAEAQKLRRETVGQTFSASCKYPPQRGNSYKSKIWYRKQADKQIWLVSTSKPRELAQNSRYVIWDDPDMGITNVIMTELKGEDTGNYVCAMKNSKGGIVSYKNIFLIVTPG